MGLLLIEVINQVFQWKTLVIKIMNVGGRAVVRASTVDFRSTTRTR